MEKQFSLDFLAPPIKLADMNLSAARRPLLKRICAKQRIKQHRIRFHPVL